MHGVTWPTEKRAELVTLWNAGVTIRDIAERTGVSERTISDLRYRCGLPKRVTQDKWDAAAHDLLLSLWTEGFSASVCARQINEKFGTSFTRNAVIGRAHRSMFPMRATIKGGQHTIRRARGARSKAPKLAVEKRIPPPEVEIIDTQIPFGQRKTFLELDLARECHWPVGTPGTEGFFFCGGRTDDGCSYCTKHYARSVARHVRTGKGFNFNQSRFA
jgi:GcrA cell cycle regulator